MISCLPSFQLVPPSLLVRNENDEKVAKFLWSSWAKFALSGEPGWKNCTNTQFTSSFEYLNIQLNPHCQNTGLFDEEKMAFWDELLYSSTSHNSML